MEVSDRPVPTQNGKLRKAAIAAATAAAVPVTADPVAAASAPTLPAVEVIQNTVEPAAPEAAAPVSTGAETFRPMREWTAFSMETFAALVQAGDILALGSHDLLRQARESGQAAFDESVSNLRAIAAAKTVKDSLELQTTLVRSSFEHTLAQTKRMMLASFALAEKASAPLIERAAVADAKLRSQTM